MKSLLNYHIKMYIKSNKFIAPFLFWIVFLSFNYMVKPSSYLPSIGFSGMILYFIMIWVSFSYMDSEDTVSEQIIILKIQSAGKYYISKILFLLIISVGLSLVGDIYPLFKHILNDNSLFTRNLTVCDMICSFLLLSSFTFLGCALGSMFHPRIVSDRKIAVVLVLLAGLLGYVKGPLCENTPVLKFILWIFPPVYDIIVQFNELEYFNFNVIIKSIILSLIYSLILFLVQIFILKKKKF